MLGESDYYAKQQQHRVEIEVFFSSSFYYLCIIRTGFCVLFLSSPSYDFNLTQLLLLLALCNFCLLKEVTDGELV
jgi:hypothetical protein